MEAIKKVIPGTSKKMLVPGWETIIFLGKEILSFNDKLSVCVYLEDLPEDFELSVNAEVLFKALKSVKDEEVVLSTDGLNLVIQSDSTEIGLPLNLNFDTVIGMIESLDINGKFIDLPKDFIEGLKLCKFAVSDNYNHPRGLFQIYIGQSICASDAFRASMYAFEEEFPHEFLIPKGSIDSIIMFEPTSISFQEGWVHFQNNEEAYMSCRISGDPKTFPKIERFFNEKTPYTLTFPPELKTTIEDVMGVYDETSDASKIVTVQVMEDKIRCIVDKNTVKITKIIPFENKSIFSFKISAVFLIELLGLTTTLTLSNTKALFKNENFQHVILLAQESVVVQEKEETEEKPKLANRRKLRNVHKKDEEDYKEETKHRVDFEDDIPF
jgi:hypothetical protein